MRHILLIATAAGFFIFVSPSSAQISTSATPLQNPAPSPSGTGPTGYTIGTVNDDLVGIDGQERIVMHLGAAQKNQPGIRFVSGSVRPAPWLSWREPPLDADLHTQQMETG